MRLICTKLYYYRFKYDIFSKGLHPLKYIDEFKPGDETLKKSFASGFLFVENCRIRGPPSFNLKKFKSKGERKWILYLREGSIRITLIL